MNTSVDINASDDDTAWPADAVEVGRILDAFGVKGWIKVQPYSSDPKGLMASRRWFLKAFEGAAKKPGAAAPSYPRFLDITVSQLHGDNVVAQPRGVADRGGAEALRGASVFVSRANFPAAGIDEYYWVDLIGLSVVNREGASLGTVIGLMDTGPHSVLRLQPDEGPDAEERLVPFVAAHIDEVSLENKRIVADWDPDF
ncbi:MAG: rRNA processing protein RimM [Rhizobacter sp.]|nr:rRNA processing protein RimM [Rhizobacter sp.]